MKLIFVCHGNICRSTMAEFVMLNLVKKANLSAQISVISRATSREEIGNDTHFKTKAILKKYQIPFFPRQARQISAQEFANSDMILCMDAMNFRNLERMFGKSEKIFFLRDFSEICAPNLPLNSANSRHLEIADPYYTDDFETTYAQISLACENLVEILKANFSS